MQFHFQYIENIIRMTTGELFKKNQDINELKPFNSHCFAPGTINLVIHSHRHENRLKQIDKNN